MKRKNTSLSGAWTHESIISSGQKFFVCFLVQVKIAQSPFEINWHLGEWNNVGTILMGHPVFGVQKLLDKHFMVWIPLLKYKWVIGNSNPKIIILKHTAHCMQKKNVSYLKGVHGVRISCCSTYFKLFNWDRGRG